MLFAALALVLSAAQAAPPRPRPCAAPVHRQFDFWVGHLGRHGAGREVRRRQPHRAGRRRLRAGRELELGGRRLHGPQPELGGQRRPLAPDLGRLERAAARARGRPRRREDGARGRNPRERGRRSSGEEPDHLEPRARRPREAALGDVGRRREVVHHRLRRHVPPGEDGRLGAGGLPPPARRRLDRARRRPEARGARGAHGHAGAGRALRPPAVGRTMGAATGARRSRAWPSTTSARTGRRPRRGGTRRAPATP